MTEEIVINDDNFHEYFFETRKNRIKPGQVLVRFVVRADFADGMAKNHIIDLILKNKVQAAINAMRLANNAVELDSIRVVKEISADLLAGMSKKEVEEKCYRYTLEKFYYAEPKNVPNDPHWKIIPISNMSKIFDKDNNSYEISSEIKNLDVEESLKTE